MKESDKTRLARVLIPLFAAISLLPVVSGGMALVAGLVTALALGNPYLATIKPWTSRLLGWSVMGLGAGMDLFVIARVGATGVGYTIVGIVTTLALGFTLGKWWRIERDTGLLISVGTAICGGSAIAAVAPTIGAKNDDISVALGTVFLLNAAALFIFPWVGQLTGLQPAQFGLWSALAIHDTSSVVGAAVRFGGDAISTAAPVKLARAMWIVPLVFALKAAFPVDSGVETKPKFPWFILGFIAVAAVVTFIPAWRGIGNGVAAVARQTLTLTLFLIGSSVTTSALKKVGARPLLLGIALWAIVATVTLLGIQRGWIV